MKFDDPVSVGVALHLTNTVFIDRALIVVAVTDGLFSVPCHLQITSTFTLTKTHWPRGRKKKNLVWSQKRKICSLLLCHGVSLFFALTGRIPDQFAALKLMAPSNAVAGVQPSQNWPSSVINQVNPFASL